MLSIKVAYFFIFTFFVLCVQGAPQDNDILKFFDRNATDFNNFKKSMELNRENDRKNDELRDQMFKIKNDMDKNNDIIFLDIQRREEMESHRHLGTRLFSWPIWIIIVIFIFGIGGCCSAYERCSKKREARVIHRQSVLVVVVPDENTEQQQPSNGGTAPPPCYEEAVTIAPLPTAEELLAKKQNN